MADAAKRSIDAIRFVDALLIGLMAAQAAILAIYLERLASADAFAKSLVWVMDWALVLCALTLSSTIAAKEGPDSDDFIARFPEDPGLTRSVLMRQLEPVVERNETLRAWKLVALAIGLAMTIGDILAATRFNPVQWLGGQ